MGAVKNYPHNLELELQALRRVPEWNPEDSEYAGGSAYLISNSTVRGDSVHAFDSSDIPSRIADWFMPGTNLWWVWYACKSAIRKGRNEQTKEKTEQIHVERIFVVDDSLMCNFSNVETVPLGDGDNASLSSHDKLLIVMWAQEMIGVNTRAIRKEDYKAKVARAHGSPGESSVEIPDYAFLVRAGSKTDFERCVGFSPKGIWYPNQRWPGPGTNPVVHFKDVWKDACDLKKVLAKIIASEDPQVGRILAEKTSNWRKALTHLDKESFQAFEADWQHSVNNVQRDWEAAIQVRESRRTMPNPPTPMDRPPSC